jgi:ATP-dependent RNA helicase RhlB
MMKFEELSIHEDLLKAIQEIGFAEMTPIQEKAIPVALEGKDITGLAQTGTGKTISFLVPIINRLFTDNPEGPVALILAPTRELVMQICEEAKRLLKFSDKKIATIIGGTGYKEQEKELSDKADLIVATPGRLIDHIKSGKLNLSLIQFFVLDEADRMFDMGFIKDIRYVMKKCPDNKQVMLYSATLSYYVMRLASEYLRDPVEVKVESENIVTENIDQALLHLARDEKMPYLINSILKDDHDGLGIIFTNLKLLVPEIVMKLRRYGIAVTGLSSMLDQKKRIRLLKEFKLGKYKYMVATDVASRGIDVDNIKIVYNYDLPMDVENYVHRIGRTARAGKTGKSMSFCSERDYTELEKIERYLGYKIPVGEVQEEYLKYPQGEFEPFVSGDGMDKLERPNRDKKFSKEKTFSKEKPFSNNKDKRKDRPDKKPYEKPYEKSKPKEKVNPLEEAMTLLEKADIVLEKEGKKPKDHPKKDKKNKRKDKPFKESLPKLEDYPKEGKVEVDKTKRNLFDIDKRDNYKPRKVSLWKRIKSFFGF